jgi:hypothetical protein
MERNSPSRWETRYLRDPRQTPSPIVALNLLERGAPAGRDPSRRDLHSNDEFSVRVRVGA